MSLLFLCNTKNDYEILDSNITIDKKYVIMNFKFASHCIDMITVTNPGRALSRGVEESLLQHHVSLNVHIVSI